MKKLLIVGNWKSNKTIREGEAWIKQLSDIKDQRLDNLEIVLCPSFTLLYPLQLLITDNQLPITLGAQDVSPFPDGAYTGEISARMLKDLGVAYIMIGHSERRKYFKEDEQMLANKVRETIDAGLTPVFCVQDKNTSIPEGVKIILYEPVEAIGTGLADSPENADNIAKSLKGKLGQEAVVLYGGSVTTENVTGFCRQENLDGVAIGGASLDAAKFLEILKNASQI